MDKTLPRTLFAMQVNVIALVGIGVVVVIFMVVMSAGRVTRRCPRCREVNREHAVFCAQCGARLPGQ